VHATHKIGWIDLQRVGEPNNRGQRRSDLAALDGTGVGAMHADHLSQLLLGE
jgi:hypothetical protein